MSQSDPQEMPLHAQVAEKVFGQEVEIRNLAPRDRHGYPEPTWCYDSRGLTSVPVPIPRYDEDMNEAAKVVERMFELGYGLCHVSNNLSEVYGDGTPGFRCAFSNVPSSSWRVHVVLAAAICLTAIDTLAKKDEEGDAVDG